ncbi:sialate O-acetylesterase [Marinimicrobium sp. ARAG 43.8]|uniref:sialate O-acetylesterase n=1 Tax=Marinimicrobium sp. ARAG 43.8 TaxID=3418719 RepID=UPI003CF2A15C
MKPFKTRLGPLLLVPSLWCAAISSAHADITLPRLINDGMVLQRDARVTVWGWAEEGESVSVHFQEKTLRTEAGEKGRWQITLPEMPAGGPYTMTITGNNRLEINDILVGDVWVASGQSNMELPMRRVAPLYQEEMNEANYPDIRYFEVPDRYAFKAPAEDLDAGEWVSITPETLPPVSAVSYFFARDLNRALDVPIGVINAALGGSPVESWLSEEALKPFPRHLQEAKRWRDDTLIVETEASDRKRQNEWFAKRDQRDAGYRDGEAIWARPDLDDSDWDTIELPGFWGDADNANGVWWLRKTIEVPQSWAGKPAFMELGRLVDADVVYVNGEKVGETGYQYPPRWYPLSEGLLNAGENTVVVRLTSQSGRPGFVEDKPYELRWNEQRVSLAGEWRLRQGVQLNELGGPTFIRWKPLGLYNGMIAPLTPFAVKGVIWYQGESNVGRAPEYRELFAAMIRDWRQQWQQPEQAFLFVQLANYLEAVDYPVDSAPAPDTAGDTQGDREHLGEWARLREAQQSALNLPHTGMAVAIDVGEWNDIHPLNKEAVGERLALSARAVAYDEKLVFSGPLYRSMKRDGQAITIQFDHTGDGLVSCDGQPLAEFAVAGDNRHFVWADARVQGDTVVVRSDAVRHPVAVRYAWANNPDSANLCNHEGLPAAPFRTDDWPSM